MVMLPCHELPAWLTLRSRDILIFLPKPKLQYYTVQNNSHLHLHPLYCQIWTVNFLSFFYVLSHCVFFSIYFY